MRAYCRVPRCGDPFTRLGNRNLSAVRAAHLIHVSNASRVGSVISNCTGRCVFCCSTIDRAATLSPWHTSRTRSLTRSQPRSLLSMP